jgi:hypothetical protein
VLLLRRRSKGVGETGSVVDGGRPLSDRVEGGYGRDGRKVRVRLGLVWVDLLLLLMVLVRMGKSLRVGVVLRSKGGVRRVGPCGRGISRGHWRRVPLARGVGVVAVAMDGGRRGRSRKGRWDGSQLGDGVHVDGD